MSLIYDINTVSTKSPSPPVSLIDIEEMEPKETGSMPTFSFEIDVKPKKRSFATLDEKLRFINDYKRKLKTELCKTYMLKGVCRYGDRCSFAHGVSELKEKIHLNQNYKTKPCKTFFLNGVCPYGYRCQYLHRELIYTDQYKEFMREAFESWGGIVPHYDTEIKHLFRLVEDGCLGEKEGRRLGVFENLEK